MTMLISKLKNRSFFLFGVQGNLNNPTILQKINAALYFVTGRLARRRSRKTLVGLDDRMLNDIGITRWQAEEELKQDFWK